MEPRAAGAWRGLTQLHEYVSRRAASHPTGTAIVMGSERITYGDLNALSNRLSHWLDQHGCGPGDRVCMLTSKTPDAVIGILGALKVGAAYVPIDIDAPASRVATMIERADPAAIVADGAGARHLGASPDDGGAPRSIPIVRVDDGPGNDWRSGPEAEVTREGRPEDLAYIMFTSGSTGVPKGVMVTHANVVAFVEWAVDRFKLSDADRASGHPPLFFDLSVFDLFGTFAAGAELHLIPPTKNLDPQGLLELISSSRLTQWFSVPSAMTYLAIHGNMDAVDLSSLERVLWCGDVLPMTTLLRWMERLPDVHFTNLYGPTESTIASSWYTVPAAPSDGAAALPIGVPCDGERMYVLDEALSPLPTGTVGDLYIGGVGVSPGYWRDEERTADAFLSDPWAADDPNARIYRTGDLASIDQDGLFHFHGRSDFQVKSRGYRIELGEIELALHALGFLRECAVVGVAADGFEGTTICCAYVPHPGRDEQSHPRHLRTALRATLPSYMIPSRWRVVRTIPTTSNGKIDRKSVRRLFEAPEP